MAPPKSDFDREMVVLEGEIKRLEAEYNMFFAGRLPRLPWETRKKVEQLVKKHDRQGMRNTADRFRFGTLQTRFYKFLELWERQLTAKESGRVLPGQKAPPPAVREKEKPKKKDGVELRDPDAQPELVRDFYEQLSEARKKAGEQPIEFERVQALVKAQVKQLSEGGAHDVEFRIGMKDGKVNLTVKAKKESEKA